jgi:hypothetical protein
MIEYSAVVTFSAVVSVPDGAPMSALQRARNCWRISSDCAH